MLCLPLVSGGSNNGTVTIKVTKGAAGEATAAIVRSELMSQGSINARKKMHEMEENLALVAQWLAKITRYHQEQLQARVFTILGQISMQK
jgi:hypothetical protein